MATVQVQGVDGTVLGERELPDELFDAPVNVPVMHQVVVAGMAAKRAGTHSTKTRGEVSGGGKKPWRQKGTGRARQGSIRAPQWTGGGISHGPQPRSYEMRVNKTIKRAALRAALTDALRSGKVAVVDRLAFDAPRTKDAVGLLTALGLDGKVLVVTARPDDAIERSFRNLGHVKLDHPGNLSTYDLLVADRVLFTGDALDLITGQEFVLAAIPTGDEGDATETEDVPETEDATETEDAADDTDATEEDEGVDA
jgi:large subunit ribosomal protein L4